LIIPGRFNGPAGSGNGGYSAGLIAAAFADVPDAEVTLRVPPPLDTPLTLRDNGVYDDERLIATVAPAAHIDAVVPPVSASAAAEASRSYAGFADHPFPTCYVCGPARSDGLGIFPGRLSDGRTAAPWRVGTEVGPATVWAALDCPGGWAIIGPGRPYVLGRIAVRLVAMPAPGDECVVVGACVSVEGRKAAARTTLYGPAGDVLATAAATWIEIPSP
jgi:hypothetical protein